jgi:hypothetical protein
MPASKELYLEYFLETKCNRLRSKAGTTTDPPDTDSRSYYALAVTLNGPDSA